MIEITQTKICTKCKVEQDLACFSKNKNHKDGLQSQCKQCWNVWNKENKDKCNEARRKYYAENKDKDNAVSKAYREKNKDKVIVANKMYYDLNKDKIAGAGRKYRVENKEKIADYQKAYRKTTIGVLVSKNSSHKRRVIAKQGDVTTQQLLELEQNSKVCYWCNISLKNKKVHIDHYAPLSKGGQHTLNNLVVSCQKCNLTKHAKDPLVFANSVGKLL